MKLNGEYLNRCNFCRTYLSSATVLLFALTITAAAQRPGSLDPTFNGDGKRVDAVIPGGADSAYSVLVHLTESS